MLDRLTESIESRLDIQANACEDFFEFACGVKKSTFEELELNNLQIIEQMLKKSAIRSDVSFFNRVGMRNIRLLIFSLILIL